MLADNAMVIMGRIVAPYGVFGWLKVIPDTEAIDGLFDYEHWWIGKHPQWVETVVEAGKIHNDILLVKLEGVDDREAAFALKGKQVAVPRSQLPAPEENEYYWSDLIGLRVKNLQAVDFGVITDVLETGANDVIVVREDLVDGVVAQQTVPQKQEKEKAHERLLPFIASVVLEVDLDKKTMLVDWDPDF